VTDDAELDSKNWKIDPVTRLCSSDRTTGRVRHTSIGNICFCCSKDGWHLIQYQGRIFTNTYVRFINFPKNEMWERSCTANNSIMPWRLALLGGT
jgi:hypothetical protein